MTLREFVGILRARWKALCAITVLGVLIAAGYAAIAPRTYTATAQVYFSTEGQASSAKDGSGNPVIVSTTDLTTLAAVVRSPSVLDPLRKDLGLVDDEPIDVTAVVTDTGNIMQIVGKSSSAQLAADIANKTGPRLAAVAGIFSPLVRTTGFNVKVTPVSPAQTPISPTSPNLVQDVLLGLTVGFLAAIAWVMIRNNLDTRVRTEEQLRAQLDAPLLTRIPQTKGARPGSLVSSSRDWSSYNESIRRLRANLMFVDVTTAGHSFTVTSAHASEGKTTTAVNLALAMAEGGIRTLLIDGDLRRPAVAEALGLEPTIGLTTVLLGRAAPEDVMQPVADSALVVIAAGQVPPNPSELLGSERMREVFDKLAASFEMIVVDSPPTVPVIDAMLLARLTGGLVVVVSSGRTRKRDLVAVGRIAKTADNAVSGTVLNGANPKLLMQSSYDGYYGHDRARHRANDNAKPANRTAKSTAG